MPIEARGRPGLAVNVQAVASEPTTSPNSRLNDAMAILDHEPSPCAAAITLGRCNNAKLPGTVVLHAFFHNPLLIESGSGLVGSLSGLSSLSDLVSSVVFGPKILLLRGSGLVRLTLGNLGFTICM